MLFESGRKLGLAASLMAVILPFIGLFFSFQVFGISQFVINNLTGGLYSITGAPLFSLGAVIIQISVLLGITLIGFIPFISAMQRLSQYYKEPTIFKNALYGLIISLVGIGSALAVIITVASSAIASAKIVGNTTTVSPMTGTLPIILQIVIFVAFAIEIVSSVFYMRAFHKLGEKSGVTSFNRAGTLYLIGTVLVIAIIGGLLFWIAWIYAASGFNSLKPKVDVTSNLPHSVPSSSP